MPEELTEWVVYQPPKSVAFGHQSRIRDPRRAWRITTDFLVGLTSFGLGHRIELGCESPGITRIDAIVAKTRLDEARQLFGPEIDPSRPYPRWQISKHQIEPAIQFALDDDKFPKQQSGPTQFHFYYNFLWNEFEQLPNLILDTESRDPKSLLGITFGNRNLFLQPRFIFPAPWDSEVVRQFIARIEPLSPFRFRDQYFKRMLPVKRSKGSGRGGRVLNLDRNWRQ